MALAASTTVIDVEPLYYVLMGDPFTHRIWHSYALALIVFPILVSISVYLLERHFKEKLLSTYNVIKLKPPQANYSITTIYVSCLIGGFSHVFFDMFTHENLPYVMYPFFYGNPFYLGQARFIVEGLVAALAVYALYCWWMDSKIQAATRSSENSKYRNR